MPRRTINDLSLLDPRFRQHQLHDSFTPTADLHAILMEFREYHSLPDPAPASYQHANLFVPLLEIYSSHAGEIGENRFSHLTGFCKTLLVLPHSTADPERLFSMIGSRHISAK